MTQQYLSRVVLRDRVRSTDILRGSHLRGEIVNRSLKVRPHRRRRWISCIAESGESVGFAQGIPFAHKSQIGESMGFVATKPILFVFTVTGNKALLFSYDVNSPVLITK